MKPDRFELELQDYLDGRLSDEARAAFEARIEKEPELARRIRLDREVGGALRVETEADAPSPGFYTRARTRFEESSAVRTRGRAWFRPFSLETVGLATAVVITAVVFVPRMGDLQFPESEVAPETKLEPAATPRPVVESRLEESIPAEKRETAAADSFGDAVEEGEKKPPPGPPEPARPQVGRRSRLPADSRAKSLDELEVADDDYAPSPAATSPESKGETARGRVAGSTAPVQTQDVFYEPRKNAPERARSAESRQSAAKEATPPAPSEPSVGRRDDERAGDRRDFAAGPLAQAATGPVAFALPRGAVDPGSVDTLRTPEAWERLSRLGASRANPYRVGRRIVLVGARSFAFSCSNLTVETGPDHHEIRLFAPVDPEEAATFGCGVDLPDDGKSVRVVAADRDE